MASIVLALAAPAAHAQFTPKIIGGSPATTDEYQWQAAVVFDPAKWPGDAFDRQFCGGSLVTPYIILTAGHCIHQVDPDPGNSGDLDSDDVNVVLGEDNLSAAPSSSEYNVQSVSKHPGYENSYGHPSKGVPSNDVGYLVLQSPYSGGTPIDIAGPDEGPLWDPGSPERITGWGTTEAGSGSETLLHATVPIVADSTCASSPGYTGYFNASTMVCAGYTAGGVDTCQGDSGGPMQAAIGGGAYRLVGITSWGAGCAEPDAPGVYTRVAGASLRPAVASTVFDLETTFGLPHEDIVGGDDTDPPETTITAGPSGFTNDPTPTFEFSSDEGGSTFECSLVAEGVAASFGACSDLGSHTPNPALADGEYSFEVRATDPSNNTDATPASRSFTVDTAPPTDPTLSSPSHTTGVASSDPTVDVTFSGASDSLSGVDGFSYFWDTSPTTLPDQTKEAEESATGTTSPSLPDGSNHYFHLRTRDNAGNWTSTVHLGPFVIDTTGPAAPTITATSPPSPANDNNPEVIGTIGGGSPIQVKLYTNGSCSGSPAAAGTVAQFTGAGITVGVPGDTTTTLSARASDALNNDSGCSNAISYVEDSTPPAIPTITVTVPNSPSNQNSLKLLGTAEAGSTVKLYEAATTADCTVGNLTDTDTATNFAVSGLDASVSSDTTTTFRVSATDAAGNLSTCSAGFDYVEDSTAPTDPTLSSPSHTTGVASSDPTVEVTFSGATDGLSGLDGFSYLWDAAAATTPDTTKDAEESATGTTSPTLPDGSHYFHLRTRDNAGNWTSTVHLGPFVIEGSPAPPPITPPVLGGGSDGTPPAVQVSARLKRNGTVVLRLACNEECFANATGSLAAGRSSFKLKPAGTGIAAGSSALLRLAPKGGKARRLLRGGLSGIARIVVTFADRGGNSTIRALRVRKK